MVHKLSKKAEVKRRIKAFTRSRSITTRVIWLTLRVAVVAVIAISAHCQTDSTNICDSI